jgi:hypothetical protein
MNWFHSMLTDGSDDGISSKRAITVAAFLLCAAGFVGDLIWDKKVDPNVYESMMYIAIAGLGFTASEKFSKQKPKE